MACGAFAAPALAQSPHIYLCERGVEGAVCYFTQENGTATAVLYVENQLVKLENAVSASGARYLSSTDGPSYEWWEKGGEAVLNWQEPDQTDTTPILTDCKVKP